MAPPPQSHTLVFICVCVCVCVWLPGVFVAVCRLSLVVVSGDYSSFCAQASHDGDFFYCRSWTVEHRLNDCGSQA